MMATNIRPEPSRNSPYWLDRHRYYELKHFCLQYPQWRRAYAELDGFRPASGDLVRLNSRNGVPDPTASIAEARLYFAERMHMVERAATEAGQELNQYLLRGVTEGLGYEYLRTLAHMPCGKDVYYDIYRRFFWLLDKARK